MWDVISLGEGLLSTDGQFWTVNTPVEKRVRHFSQKANGEYYAVITLCVEPYDGSEGIVFINAATVVDDFSLPESDPEEDWVINGYIDGVIAGIKEVLNEKSEKGFILTSLLITLLELRIHPVESYPKAFQRAAVLAMNQCLEQDNLVPKKML